MKKTTPIQELLEEELMEQDILTKERTLRQHLTKIQLLVPLEEQLLKEQDGEGIAPETWSL